MDGHYRLRRWGLYSIFLLSKIQIPEDHCLRFVFLKYLILILILVTFRLSCLFFLSILFIYSSIYLFVEMYFVFSGLTTDIDGHWCCEKCKQEQCIARCSFWSPCSCKYPTQKQNYFLVFIFILGIFYLTQWK